MTPSPSTANQTRDAAIGALFFAASTLITWWFIEAGDGLYASHEKMLLSCGIAGGKWALQIGAAMLVLRNERWAFIRRLGAVCLAGSVVLLPYCFASMREMLGSSGFLASIIAAVALMIALYWRAVWRSGLHPRWFWGWIACLAIAVTLQVTVVFG